MKEGDGPEIRLRPPLSLPPGVPNAITPAGDAAFRARLDQARADRAALGDGGLDHARKLDLDDEIRWLNARIASFTVTVPPDPPEQVCFGCAVTIDGDRGERTLRLVGVDEADGVDAISWLSPVARALMGSRVGDEVELRTPGGEAWVEVRAIRDPDQAPRS